MRYVFIIQGEGRGHMTQSIALAEMLRRNGHQIVEVLVGECSNRALPQFFVDKINAPITRYKSPALDYSNSGRNTNMWRSIRLNLLPSQTVKWISSMQTIARTIRRVKPNVVVNFYELLMGVTTMSTLLHLRTPIVSIAHQFMLEHPEYRHKATSSQGQMMMKTMNKFCSWGSCKTLALSIYDLPTNHYRSRGKNIVVVPPLLRPEIFSAEVSEGDYILGYMLNPAFLDDILEWKAAHPELKVHLFWDKAGEPKVQERVAGLWLHQINDSLFLQKMAGSRGYITTAGFESVCEAFYLGKPVMMIPAHIEQQINARDAASAGVGIISEHFDLEQLNSYIPTHSGSNKEFHKWIASAEERFLHELTNIKN